MNKNNQEFYISPEVEMIEIHVQTVICQSGGINNMN